MWCIVRVREGTEEYVRMQCQEKIPRGLLEDCYIFYYEEKRHIQGEWVIQEKLLFPGYIFMVTEQAERLSEEMNLIKGVIQFLEADNKIAALTEEEIELLTAFGGKEQTIKISEGIIEQSIIKVYSGPLVGKEKYISRIDRHKRRAFLDVPMFGRRQKIRVGLEIISKT